MRTINSIFLLLLLSFTSVKAQYCVPDPGSSGCTDGNVIDNFFLLGESNTFIINNATGCSPNAYANMITDSVHLGQGVFYTAIISSQFVSNDNVAIWIDFNDDFTFSIGEMVAQHLSLNDLGSQVEIIVPLTAPLGFHCMRVGLWWDVVPTMMDPCNTGGTNSFGETHDYTVKIVGQPTCLPASDLTAANVSSSGADVTWTTPGTPSYALEYGPIGFLPGTGTYITTTNPTATLSGLSDDTEYAVYVRRLCSGSDSSAATIVVFKTLCDPFTLPYTENFDGVMMMELPPCMTVEDGNANQQPWVTTTIMAASAPNAMTSFGADIINDDWFFTPGLNLQSGNSYQVSFMYATISGPMALEVTYGNAPNALAQNMIPSFVNNNIVNSNFQTATFTVLATFTGPHYFGWHCISPAFTDVLAIDNINITAATTCDTPTVILVSNITGTAATFDWSLTMNATGYEYVLDQTAADPAGAGTSTLNTTHTATGLLPNTTYYFHVRTVCSNGFSAWAKKSFTTLPVSVVNVNEQDNDVRLHPNPAKEVTVLTAANPSGNSVVYLTDISGKEIKTIHTKESTINIDMSSLTPGIYFIRYTDDVHNKLLKVVKQ